MSSISNPQPLWKSYQATNFLGETPKMPIGQPVASKTQGPDLQAMTAWFNRQLVRQRQDIAKLIEAIKQAENGYVPKRIELIRTYNDLIMDSHLTALMDQRKSAILSRKFSLKVGDKDYTEVINQHWFYKFLEYAWESDAFGFSLVGIGDIANGQVSDLKLMERHLVDPVNHQYLRNPYVVSDINLDEPPYSDWYILIGEQNHLGWLAKAGFHVLSKKFVFTSWDEYAMVFGVPIRVAKLDQSGNSDKDQMANDLYAMGPAGVLVLDKEDDFELHSGGNSQSYQVFTEHIKARNSELSKLVVGQTMTTDDGSSRSQGEVHERTGNKIVAKDMRWIKHVVNTQLIPRLAKLKVVPAGSVFEWDQDELLSLMDQKDVDDMILRNGYEIPVEYFMEKYGVPVTGKVQNPDVITDPPGKSRPLALAAAKGQRTVPQSNSIRNLALAVATFKATGEAYSVGPDSCGCAFHSDATNKVAGPETIFNDDYLENVLREFFDGKYLRSKLPEDLYFKTATYLFDGVASGFGGQPVKFDWGTPDRQMIEALKNNVHIFSGAKTYQQRMAYNELLRSPEGRVRDWNEFKKVAMPLAKDYNVNYLRAEYQAATGQARSASAWNDIEKDKDVFPLLKYQTVGDPNVRDSHRKLDGIVRKVDDPFWDRYMPLNGWGCRCNVDKLEKDAEEITSLKNFGELGPKDQPRIFRFNPGKKKMVFDQSHPYFAGIVDSDKEWAKQNFDLPIPEPELPVTKGFKPSGRPVSEALKVGRLDKLDEAKEAIALMDSIHGDGNLPDLPVLKNNSMNAQGMFSYSFLGRVGTKIQLAKSANCTAGTLWHEIGHFLDYNGLARNGFQSNLINTEFSTIVDLANNTTEIQNIKSELYISKDDKDYYLDRREIFARAYAQFMATKTGHKGAMDEISRIVSRQSWIKNIQWSESSFEPILKQFETSFEKIGWMQKS